MEHPVPQFARSFATIAAVLATMAIAPLTMIGPALAGPHDGSGLQCGPGRSSLYPGFRIGAGFGYTDDVTAGAPAGFIGGDFGYHREVWKPGLSVGAVIGWYGLGDATVQGSGGETVQVDYSLIPAFGLVTYDAMNYRDVLFQLSGGAGAYNKKIGGVDGCNCTDFGLNLGFGVLTRYSDKSTNFGAELRYHHLPREDNSGNKYLSLMGRMTFDFGGFGKGM